MKLKQTVLIMMAAALPLTSMAAASETIPVTKDTGAVVAQNNRHDVTYRLSSTATPEQNKKLRSVANKTDRGTIEVVAPNADRYMDRKEVGVSPVDATTDHLNLVFPEVKSVSPIVEKAINTTIKKYVSKVQNDTQKLNEKESNKTNVIMYYDVKTDKNGIFSVLIHTYTMRDGDANGVNYVKGQVGKVIPQPDGTLMVQASDLLENKQILMEADMVVLAAAIEPNKDVRKIATMLTASIDTNNFLTEAHAKLRPVESPTAGIFLSGVCQGPKDIPETVAQAGAAAVKAIGLLAKDKLTTNPCTAHSDELLCNGCSQCANVCPYGAISYEEKQVNDHGIRETRRIAVVNNALCQGCGACTVTCPSGAMDLQGFSNRQILAEVDAICR